MELPEYLAHVRKKDGKKQFLLNHLLEAAEESERFASKIGLGRHGYLIGLLHDLGKYSDEFQRYIKSAEGALNPDADDYVDAVGLRGKIDHSTAGSQVIYRSVPDKRQEELFAAQILSLCLASHHSGLIDCISPDGTDNYSRRMGKSEEKAHTKEVFERIERSKKDQILDELQSREFTQNLVNSFRGLKTPQDSKDSLVLKYGLLVRFLYSCLIDADRISTADFENPRSAKLRNKGAYKKWPVLIEKLERKLRDFDSDGINTVRRKVSEACRKSGCSPQGLYQLTVPTGGGKTLSSLRFALHHAEKYEMQRIIYVLPYTTIIDQNAEELRKILEDKDNNGRFQDAVVLEHHSNLLPDRETARQKVLSENWDAPVVLTTNVQLLEALFGAGTRGARRMHQLAKAVIIFDEIQTLPVRCVQLFNTAMNFLVNNCGSTVVLCTATQPLLDKVTPASRALSLNEEHQIVPDAKDLFKELKRVEVCDRTKAGGWSNDEIKDLIHKRVIDSGSVLIVVNTKTSARNIYDLCSQSGNVSTFHLSTHMCPAHRVAVLDKIKTCLCSEPVICVSTQLIEAGVDISFGSVIRFLAGFDSIVQAAGRCNRHNEQYPALGQVYVINPAEENISSIEDIKIGRETAERLLSEFKNDPERFRKSILSPEAMEQYYQYYFYSRAKEMNYPVSVNSAVGRQDNLFNLLSVNSLSIDEFRRINGGKMPEIPIKQAFMSAAKSFNAIETSAQGVVVPYGQEGRDLINKLSSVMEVDKQYKLLHHAQRYAVNVFPNVLRKLQEQGAVYEVQEGSGILYLDEKYYSDEIGLSEVPIKKMEVLDS